MTLSVIVPVYNTEKYLDECVSSILNQSFTDFELILVDDGSTDNCPAMCDEWGKKDSRIKVIHKENGGVSSSRNAGIMASSGIYIMFIDSDDEYLPDALLNAVKIIDKTGTDRVISSLKIVNRANANIVSQRDYTFEGGFANKDEFFAIARQKRLAPSPIRYIVKKEILTANNVIFPQGIAVAEDCLWLCKLFKYIKSIKYNDCPFYQYNLNSDSATNTMNFKKLQDLMYVTDEIFRMTQSEQGELLKLYYTWCCVLTNHMMQFYSRQNSEDKKEIRQWVKINRQNLKKALKTIWPMNFASHFIGVFNTIYLFAELVKIKTRVYYIGKKPS